MNVHASTKTDFIKYEKVLDLFKTLYSVCKTFNANGHYYYCYCNRKGNQCFLCKFGEYVYYNKMDKEVLLNRENEQKLLDIAYKFWFHIQKIKSDDASSLAFFNKEYLEANHTQVTLDQVIENNIKLLKYRDYTQYF